MASLALGVQQPRFESEATASASLVPCWMKAYAERKKAQSQLGGRSMALKTLRLVFALLVCLTFIFTLGTELTYRLGMHGTVNQALNKTLFIWPTHKAALFSGSHHLPVNFNQTLLSYAAIQIGEADERQQIQDLLNATGSSYDVKQRSKLSHPRYADYWSVFHRALQSWAQNKHFEPTIMTQLIDLVKVPIDQHYMATNQTNLSDIHIGNRTDQEVYLFDSDNKTTLLKHHQNQGYRSCAVVGNSGILLQRPHGPLIDSHEMVIRLNNARTSGFEPNVGSKTTLAFVNSNIFHSCAMRPDCFCHSYGETVPVIMYICQAVHFMDYARCNASKKVPLLVTDARFDNLCARIVKYYSLRNFLVTTGKHPEEWSSAHDGNMFHYSSGMQAVMLALGICEKVSMFGFGKSDRAKHHYHTNQRFELGLHDYEAEYQFYADLVRGSQYIPFLSEAGIKLPPVQIYF